MEWTKIDYELVKVDQYNWHIGVMAFMREYDRQHLQEHHRPTLICGSCKHSHSPDDPCWFDSTNPAKPEVCECMNSNWIGWIEHVLSRGRPKPSYCPWCGRKLKGGG